MALKLDFNPNTRAFIWDVPPKAPETEEGVAWARKIGLDYSFTASEKACRYIYFTHLDYAALPLFQYGTLRARDELFLRKLEYDASWEQHSQRNIAAPPGLDYHPFQKSGIEYGLNRRNVIVGDQPGLGKTIQAIGIANECQMDKVLVICPASVRLQWRKEILKWSVRERPLIYPVLKSADGVHPNANWIIVSYDLARSDVIHDLLLKHHFDMLVLDELHYLKTIDARRTRAVFGGADWEAVADRAEKIVGLTGTPLPNRPRECYTAVRSMCWDAIDWVSEDVFRGRFNPSIALPSGGVYERVGRLPELQARLRCNLMVRRMKRDVLDQLPSVTYEITPVQEDKAVRAATKAESLLEIDPEALAQGQHSGFDGQVSTVRREMGEALAPHAIEHVKMLMDGGLDKLVLFAWHRSVMDTLEEALSRFGVVRIDGGTSATAKYRAVQKFQQDDRTRIILGNLLASGTGVDGLQKVCSHAVFAESSWTPGDNEQCVDRLWRMEQKHGVLAQFLVAPGSVSERILHTAVEKAQQTHAALDRTAA
jgi:SWI/SNF-related matrix-associated actin-dependent regulator 1 of chromatin subfamily A